MERDTPDVWVLSALLALAIALVVVFAYNGKQSWDDWRVDRGAPALRTLLMAALLLLGMVVILLGRVAAFFPDGGGLVREALRLTGTVLTGSIIAVGLALTISWRRHP